MTTTSPTQTVAAPTLNSDRPLENVKVLVVEDDEMIRDLVLTKLGKSGCTTFAAVDGAAVLPAAEEHQPDAIVLDLMLPTKTGEEVLAELKAHDTLRDVPVIVFSNKSADEEVKNVMDMGAARFFIKAHTNLNDLVHDIKALTGK